MLKERREKKGLTQSELGEKIGKKKSYVSKLESHPHLCNPSIDTIFKLSKGLCIHHYKVLDFFGENRVRRLNNLNLRLMST